MHRKSLEAADKLKDYDHASEDDSYDQSERSTPSPSQANFKLEREQKQNLHDPKLSSKDRCDMAAGHDTENERFKQTKRKKVTEPTKQSHQSKLDDGANLNFFGLYSKSQNTLGCGHPTVSINMDLSNRMSTSTLTTSSHFHPSHYVTESGKSFAKI